MLVKDVMKEVIAIDHDISVKQAAKIMSEKEIGSLVVLKDDKIAGIVTEKDIVKNISGSDKKISLIMSKNIITIEKDEDLEFAAELMTKNKIKRIPVTEDNKLIGIISSSDLVSHLEDADEEFFID